MNIMLINVDFILQICKTVKWSPSPSSIREQCELKKKLIKKDAIECFQKDTTNDVDKVLLNYVGGVDMSFVKGDDKHACAALVILSYPELQV